MDSIMYASTRPLNTLEREFLLYIEPKWFEHTWMNSLLPSALPKEIKLRILSEIPVSKRIITVNQSQERLLQSLCDLSVFETFPYTPIELWTPDLAMFFYEIHASELYRLGGILAGIGSPRMDVIRPRVPKLHIKYQYNVAVARKAIIGHQGLVAHEYWSQQWINDPFVIELSIKLNAEHNFPLLSEQRKTSQLFQRLAASSRRPFLYDLSSKELIAMALRKAYPLNNLPTSLFEDREFILNIAPIVSDDICDSFQYIPVVHYLSPVFRLDDEIMMACFQNPTTLQHVKAEEINIERLLVAFDSKLWREDCYNAVNLLANIPEEYWLDNRLHEPIRKRQKHCGWAFVISQGNDEFTTVKFCKAAFLVGSICGVDVNDMLWWDDFDEEELESWLQRISMCPKRIEILMTKMANRRSGL